MRYVLIGLFCLVSSLSHAVELLNPYKGGSLAIELYNNLTTHLESKNIPVKTINLDACRVVPTVWKQYKNPLYITWSDAGKDCNVEASQIQVLSKATQFFCSKEPVSLPKSNLKIGWQSSAPLNGIYEAFEAKYGKLTRVPYFNNGQQVQGAIAGEIDIALIGQGTAMTSNLNCFMAVTPFENLPVLEHNYGEMYMSLIGIVYEDPALNAAIKEFITLPKTIEWKSRRKLQDVNVTNQRDYFIENAFRRK